MTVVTVTTQHSGIVVLALVAGALILLPRKGVSPGGRPARRRLDPAVRRMLVTGGGVAAAGLLLSMAWWLVGLAVIVTLVTIRLVPRRRPPPNTGEMRLLAGTLDLVATCLEAGLPTGRAMSAVLDATGSVPASPASTALSEVVALLALGADPQAAWRPAAALPELAALAAAAQRSAVGGVRLADAARETAAELRAGCRRLDERSAARAGVAMTAPLALCFLPAFVCLGLAPVIISLIGTLHIW